MTPSFLWHRSRRLWQCESLSRCKTSFPFPIWPLITSGGKTGQLKVLGMWLGLWRPIQGACCLAGSSKCTRWRVVALPLSQTRINVPASVERSFSSRRNIVSGISLRRRFAAQARARQPSRCRTSTPALLSYRTNPCNPKTNTFRKLLQPQKKTFLLLLLKKCVTETSLNCKIASYKKLGLSCPVSTPVYFAWSVPWKQFLCNFAAAPAKETQIHCTLLEQCHLLTDSSCTRRDWRCDAVCSSEYFAFFNELTVIKNKVSK